MKFKIFSFKKIVVYLFFSSDGVLSKDLALKIIIVLLLLYIMYMKIKIKNSNFFLEMMLVILKNVKKIVEH